ncbi:MAG: MBOAT family protein [Bacteroidetes bacterium]|nr:MBOAT family protein [Bacteroidota bacterium]MBU1717987.1 MBOAT family protein [Bacteroidota bacterium]
MDIATLKNYFDQVVGLLSYDPESPILFNTGFFLWWFFVLMTFFVVVQKRNTARIIYLTLFSLYFYYKSSGFYFVLLIISTLVDYSAGIWMFNAKTKGMKRLFLMFSLVSNFGMLGYFKYTNFFISSINEFMADPLAFHNIFLPAGISFYTFQTLSYSIDVFRGELKPVRNILDFGFYVSFFPQLVAGPIVRAKDFIPQIRAPRILDKKAIGLAVALIASGLIKKAVISDYISVNFVDRIFDEPLLYTGVENLMGIYGYALQIYCDFSGYSDVAIGIALLMGFTLPWNFNYPYRATSITDFWRRWHISLSSWLRDYLYIPLGGNKKGRVRQYVNLLLTMLLGGLWHGASWKFVLWGGLHGAALAIEKLTGSFKAVTKNIPLRILGVLVTFHFVCLGWVYFRADSFEKAIEMLNQVVYSFNGGVFMDMVLAYREVFILFVVGYMLHFVPRKLDNGAKSLISNSPLVVQALILVAVIWLIIQTKSAGIVPYIYFQF